ncbi:CcdC family protein [Bacillus marinisedimentorum]|uniref:CcdC family protein n=1 Tax=Bacillus marinisedimentorum TaxID=1821260 RepID=UPI0009F3C9C0|nr:cytochrome c biogenesis protein CcdC [Bacillus marinisedimentorum]
MLIWVSTIFAAFMASFMIFVRIKAAERPVSAIKLILPPVFMSTGFFMFAIPYFRVPPAEGAEAFLVGSLFSILLIKTSRFTVSGNKIYLQRSKAFVFLLIGLLLLRLVMKSFLGHYISFGETSGLFFILAFGMILPWRLSMYLSYKKIKKQLYIKDGNLLHP